MGDRQVLVIREDDVVTSDAYLFLYQRRHESSSFDTVTSHEDFFPMESSTPLPPITPVFLMTVIVVMKSKPQRRRSYCRTS